MTTTTSTNDEIACPHGCGVVMCDLWDFGWERDEVITECSGCLKPITITRVIRATYTAYADGEAT